MDSFLTFADVSFKINIYNFDTERNCECSEAVFSKFLSSVENTDEKVDLAGICHDVNGSSVCKCSWLKAV